MTEKMTVDQYKKLAVLTMGETEFQTMVLDHAKEQGWMVHHCRKAMRGDGQYRTPIQGHKGFPDVVFARNGDVLFVEFKSETGTLTGEQADWLNELNGGPINLHEHHPAVVWRPRDWNDNSIQETLQ
ncbi:MAG: hypothetical protein DWQ40_00335 [Actinobacteria bacterium]|nr:MAG: hypothetical protein DWQ40_00335 [Actinomycetota bacterium]REK35583.1 MAG: hypothetical protein DWQ20_06050 [Actinomycetota bacterium]